MDDDLASPTAPAREAALREAIRSHRLADESACLRELAQTLVDDPDVHAAVEKETLSLVAAVREKASTGLDALLKEFDLSTDEGVLLMSLAEALTRTPDPATQDRLIRDKLSPAHWEEHIGPSHSWLVNASAWGLMLGRDWAIRSDEPKKLFSGLVTRLGEPMLRVALRQAIAILAQGFVMGRTIEEAIARAKNESSPPSPTGDQTHYSFDMLGEAALGQRDVEHYTQAYTHAIQAVAHGLPGKASVSVKLSALHPRYDYLRHERVLRELTPRLLLLATQAQRAKVDLTVDAEEADRLALSLRIFERVFRDIGPDDWGGLGLAVQAYQKRAPYVIDWLEELASSTGRRIPVRLVKGAYWDTEVKHAQTQGLEGFPVFTTKAATDVSYLACAKRLLAAQRTLRPQFATHNAYTVAWLLNHSTGPIEFQRLHGMGEALYEAVLSRHPRATCRVYAPVGAYRELLPYLVRRLLENGANSSFINRVRDQRLPPGELAADPVRKIKEAGFRPNPGIPPPKNLFGSGRANSAGIDFADEETVATLQRAVGNSVTHSWEASPIGPGLDEAGEAREIFDPADRRRLTGVVYEASAADVNTAMDTAYAATESWDACSASERGATLRRAGDLIERHRQELIALCVRESGKTAVDAASEVREAVDYCRYYAEQAEAVFGAPQPLPGPTGEANSLSLHGRGVFACISPWNFPVAIFTGQIVAALAAGNPVVAKPASQTPLVGGQIVRLLLEAGIPEEVLQFVPGPSARVAPPLLGHPALSGVAFTGSTDAAKQIHRVLASREGPIPVLIAETGGQNALIADSSALPEQLVRDVLHSAFNSTGQRCSALRVLFVQEEIADAVLALLRDAMDELRVGDPIWMHIDVGPVIDDAARRKLEAHIARMDHEAVRVASVTLPPETKYGSFVAPHVFELQSMAALTHEVFGPILHVIRFRGDHIDGVVDAINATGYGLTLGIHSRVEATVKRICARARVGNIYVNRHMIGAVVGSQPFGGEGLSGTGPKAGGPHTLLRFATERAITVNTAAIGGDVGLFQPGTARP